MTGSVGATQCFDGCQRPHVLQPPWPVTGVEKGQKRVKNNLFFRLFQPFFNIFSAFFDPGVERPRELFFQLFGDFGPEGPE